MPRSPAPTGDVDEQTLPVVRELGRAPEFAPSAGFAASILARIASRFFWRRRLAELRGDLRFLTRRPVTAAATAAVAAVGPVIAWLVIGPSATAQLGRSVVDFLAVAAADAVLLVGRTALRLGLLDSTGSAGGVLDPATALIALLAFGAVATASAWIMVRQLARVGPAPAAEATGIEI